MRLLKSGRVPKANLDRLWKDIQQAERETLNAARPVIDEVIRYVVGTRYYDLKSLAKMGHPYATHAPGGLHPGIINVQSGEFFKSFRMIGPEITKTKAVLYVSCSSWKGNLLLAGGGRMIPRPWDTYLMWHLQRALKPKLGAMFAQHLKLRKLD
jgi:hypothetical protein